MNILAETTEEMINQERLAEYNVYMKHHTLTEDGNTCRNNGKK